MTHRTFRTLPIRSAVIAVILVSGLITMVHIGSHRPVLAVSTAAAVQLYTCGMHPQVIQDHPGSCPICGMALTPINTGTTPSSSGERKVKYWWDPMMNPPYIADQPGKSPMGMDLVPVYEEDSPHGTTITIDPVVVQNMGVRVAPAVDAPLRRTVRAAGFLTEPEPGHFDVNLRVSGWIEKLYANVDGMHIGKGDPLFELYSPELQVAIEELIAARKLRGTQSRAGTEGSNLAADLYSAAHRKLELLGLYRDQIDRYATLARAPGTVTYYSPLEAHLTEKSVYAGAAVKAGDRILRLADRSTMWIEARIFEQDLPFVQIGQTIRATMAASPGATVEGRIDFLHPHIDPMTRTAMARMSLPNPDMLMRQGMYATVEIPIEIAASAVLVPREAVIDSGVRQVAFVAKDGGQFEPRTVHMGTQGTDGMVQILSGIAAGEEVVTSGQFLLDAESRLQEAIQKHLRDRLLKSATPEARQ